jgi:hypothetical protein
MLPQTVIHFKSGAIVAGQKKSTGYIPRIKLDIYDRKPMSHEAWDFVFTKMEKRANINELVRAVMKGVTMAVADGNGISDVSLEGDCWRERLKPGDYLVQLSVGWRESVELVYVVTLKEADDYLSDSADDAGTKWYVVQRMDGEDGEVVVAPAWTFAARLADAQVQQLRAARWPKSFQAFLDVLLRGGGSTQLAR